MNNLTTLQTIPKQIPPNTRIIVSACLLGINCRYNGESRLIPEMVDLMKNYLLIPACPEQLGGLPTPRLPAEIIQGTGEDVLNGNAKILTNTEKLDLTNAFISGAKETLRIAQLYQASAALLQQRSPSCGFGCIYQEHQLAPGNGVTAALLASAGLKIFSIY